MEWHKKRCLIIIAATMVLHFLTIYFYILEYTDERSYYVCNIVNRYEISSVKDNLEANGDETTDFHKGFRDRWTSVNAEGSAYVFAAYLIPEDFYENWFQKLRMKFSISRNITGSKTIMIVGTTWSYSLKFYCHIIYDRDNGTRETVVTKATMLDIDTDDKNLAHLCTFFACPLPDRRVPLAVSLTSTQCSALTHRLLLTEPVRNQTRNFTMCLPPMFGQSKLVHAQRFIEWVELNRILGANHFTVYNHSIGKDMNKALRLLEKKGFLEIVQWELPIDAYYYAEHAAINDCLLRNRFKSKYIINSDMDEFIIPHGENILTWNEMLHQLPQASAYSFVSAFFHNPKDVKHDDLVKSNTTDLVTLKNFIRDKEFISSRTKYMVHSSIAQRILIHNAFDLRWGKEITVDPSIAFIHHYRTDQIKNVTIDTMVYDKYASSLYRIKNVYKEFYRNDSS